MASYSVNTRLAMFAHAGGGEPSTWAGNNTVKERAASLRVYSSAAPSLAFSLCM